jgi:hypothetical protein
VLVLDMANDAGINIHGIDIRPHLTFVSDNIRSQQGLALKKQYVDTIGRLREKYATP